MINTNTTKNLNSQSDEVSSIQKLDLDKFKKTVKPKLSSSEKIKRKHVAVASEGAQECKNLKQSWAPPNWKEVLANVREMRKNFDAPVDTMGCDKCQEDTASPEVS